jgi:hypothetical protein
VIKVGILEVRRSAAPHRFPRHHLVAGRPGFDMAMNTRLVTVTPQVHLKHIDAAPLQAVIVEMESLRERLHVGGVLTFEILFLIVSRATIRIRPAHRAGDLRHVVFHAFGFPWMTLVVA